MTTPNWQHNSGKPPKRKLKPQALRSAKARRRHLIKCLLKTSDHHRGSYNVNNNTNIMSRPQGVMLSPTIDYLSMDDDQGPVGVMIFRGTATQPAQVRSVEDRDDFRAAYDEFKTYENYV